MTGRVLWFPLRVLRRLVWWCRRHPVGAVWLFGLVVVALERGL